MNTPYRALIQRLMEKRLDPDEIPALIRNVIWIVGKGGLFTAELINKELEELGWKAGVLDELSLQYIAEILYAEYGVRIKYYRLSYN